MERLKDGRINRVALMVSQLMTYGGTERVTVLLSHELSSFYDCSIITRYQNGSSVYPIDKNVCWLNCNNQKKRLRYCLWHTVKKIISYLKIEKIRVLIVVGRNNSWIPLAVKLCYPSIKLIYCEHNSLVMNDFQKSWRSRLENIAYQYLINRLSTKIVLLTKKEIPLYLHRNPSVKDKLLYIYNIVDDKLLKRSIKYNLKSKKILSVGRLDYQKGYESLIKIGARVFKKHSDWQWDIYGDGDPLYVQKLKKMVKSYSLDKNINFKGISNHLYDEYPNYAIYVMTSRWEGLPMVLLEAQANGLPIVSYDLYSGPSDIVTEAVNGYLIEPGDIDDFSAKICDLIENPILRENMSNHTKDDINKFSKDQVIKQWRHLIDSLL